MKFILVVISCCLLLSCTYMSERKRHRHIIDSLSRVEVPKYFDTIFFNQKSDGYIYETITSEGLNIRQYHPSNLRPYRMEVCHVDSVFRDVYEYDEKGRIVEYFREFIRSFHDDNAIGYRIQYDTLGNVCGYVQDIPPLPFGIYDIISILQKENVNIIDNVAITYRCDSEDQPCFWYVSVKYTKENGRQDYYARFFDPQTGKVLKEEGTRISSSTVR